MKWRVKRKQQQFVDSFLVYSHLSPSIFNKMASSKCIIVLLLAVFMLASVSAQYGCGYGTGYGYGSYYSPYSSYGSYGYYGKRDAGFGTQQQVEQPHFHQQMAKH